MGESDAQDAAPAALAALAALVVKEHVHLGSLAQQPRALVFAFVWAGLPADAVLDERALNAALRAQLADAARFLDTDHVELRRWLVDAGWLARDGFGREYRRVEPGHLPADVRSLAAALEGLDTVAWARAQRERKAEERARRQAAWAARGQGAA
jgi:hypothetical protein